MNVEREATQVGRRFILLQLLLPHLVSIYPVFSMYACFVAVVIPLPHQLLQRIPKLL